MSMEWNENSIEKEKIFKNSKKKIAKSNHLSFLVIIILPPFYLEKLNFVY